LQAIVERVVNIRKLIREVKSFRVDSNMVLTAIVSNKKDVRLAVEFIVKDAKQLRNQKSIV
jgi:hypothetical protein